VVVMAATCAVGFAAGLGVCRHDRSDPCLIYIPYGGIYPA
jgi:hypothetical protein